eukprot:TRINITY_DN56502_c0_g1_i1.p1 TRINITY_DN56502_c0_g1~~TRINITY_DN56502_c0_g1_i1.p1  ORF type:complete len:588 (-),score=63.82 TRINITY_DN56502_c0_g1_i1:118-1791(-)
MVVWANMSPAVKLALGSVIIWGIHSGIVLLEKFHAEVKPVVMAFVFVSVLETAVQSFEFLLLKIYVLVNLLIYTGWCVLVMAWKKIRNSCREDKQDISGIRKNLIFYWKWVLVPWTAKDPGEWISFRIIAVVLTLILLGISAMLFWVGFSSEGHDMVKQFPLYAAQVTSMFEHLNDLVDALSGALPASIQHLAKEIAATMLDKLRKFNLEEYAQHGGTKIVAEFFSISASFATQTVFFLLYSSFLLLAPIHISLTSAEPSGKEDTRWTRWLGWPAAPGISAPARLSRSESARKSWQKAFFHVTQENRHRKTNRLSLYPVFLPLMLESQDATATVEDKEAEELQHYLYKIMWNYFIMLIVLNAIFAGLVYIVMRGLGVDVSMLIASSSFFLSFIPELGSIASLILPMPFILLTPLRDFQVPEHSPSCSPECHLQPTCICDFPDRLKHLCWAFLWLCIIKLAVHNFLYSCSMGKNRVLSGAVQSTEKHMVSETHGALVLFAVMFFGKIWGTTGMLISVPAISVIRLSMNLVSTAQAKASSSRSRSNSCSSMSSCLAPSV